MSDQVKNFAYSTLASGISAAATSLSVASGEGARFPATASGEFNVVIWDSIYPNASVAYQNSAAEIVRVTTRATDTFTVTRAQEGTSAVAFNTSGRTYRVEMNVTAKNFEAATASLSGLVSTTTQTFAGAKTFSSSVSSPNLIITDQNGAGTFEASGFSDNRTYQVPDENGVMALTNKQFCILMSSSRLSMSQNTTYYETFGSSTGQAVTGVNTDILRIPLPAGTIRNMRVKFQSNTVDNGSTVTLMVDGSASALTVTCAWTVTTGSDTTHDVTITEGQLVSLRFVQPSGGSGAAAGFGVTCEFYPSAGL